MVKKFLYEIRYCGRFLCYVIAKNHCQAEDKATELYKLNNLTATRA